MGNIRLGVQMALEGERWRLLRRYGVPLALMGLGWGLWHRPTMPVAVLTTTDNISQLLFSPDGRSLAMSSWTEPARMPGYAPSWLSLYSLPDGRRLWRVRASVDKSLLSPDSRRILYAAWKDDAYVLAALDARTGERLPKDRRQWEESGDVLDLSADGRLAVALGRSVDLYPPGAGRPRRLPGRLQPEDRGGIWEVRFSADGTYLAGLAFSRQAPAADALAVWRAADGSLVDNPQDPGELGVLSQLAPFYEIEPGTFLCGAAKLTPGRRPAARWFTGGRPWQYAFMDWLDAPGGRAVYSASDADMEGNRLEVWDVRTERHVGFLDSTGQLHRLTRPSYDERVRDRSEFSYRAGLLATIGGDEVRLWRVAAPR